MVIIGATRRQGEYNGMHYDNYYLYFENPSIKTCFGICPQFEKVGVDVVNNFGGIDALQGADIRFIYNKYGKVISIEETK